MTEVLTADNLNALSGVRHAFFTRAWGNAGFSRQPERALDNRARMAAHIDVAPQHLLSCYQTHSLDVITATDVWSPDANPPADALVTAKFGIALGILTADCVPVLLADDRAGVIGAAHAGWRGAVGGIIENTVAAMERLGARRESIHAALGPCIWQNSYEVGCEFPAPFVAENATHARFFKLGVSEGRYQFDLPGYVVEKLRLLGVRAAGSVADTCASPDQFFSHRYSTLRQEERQGNLMSAIVLGRK